LSTKIDLSGQIVGAIRVLGEVEKAHGQIRYLCECVCGNQFVTYGTYIRSGKTKSCGCMKSSLIATARRKYGPYREALRSVHKNMMARCYDPEDKRFKDYGGRGIIVCHQWHDFNTFYDDMEPSYQKGLTLDRKEVNGIYELSNCKWSTRLDQNRNQRRTIYLNFRGETIGLRYLAERFGIDPKLLDRRIRAGWDVERAVLPPRPIKKSSTKNSS
jgi:hypothetical protein